MPANKSNTVKCLDVQRIDVFKNTPVTPAVAEFILRFLIERLLLLLEAQCHGASHEDLEDLAVELVIDFLFGEIASHLKQDVIEELRDGYNQKQTARRVKAESTKHTPYGVNTARLLGYLETSGYRRFLAKTKPKRDAGFSVIDVDVSEANLRALQSDRLGSIEDAGLATPSWEERVQRLINLFEGADDAQLVIAAICLEDLGKRRDIAKYLDIDPKRVYNAIRLIKRNWSKHSLPHPRSSA